MTDWPGFNEAGNFDPEIANPAPSSVAESTVTTVVPVEVSVRVLVEVVFSGALPKDRALLLSVNCTVVETDLITAAPQPQSEQARQNAAQNKGTR